MHVFRCLLVTFLLLLALPTFEMKRPGKGRGIKRGRHTLTQERVGVRSGKRHSRSDPSGFITHSCSESTKLGKVYVDCEDQGLTFIPPSKAWSKAPKHLLLARNQIKVLNDGDFSGYESLKSLDLQQNLISQVEEGTFKGLTQLTDLLLQHNHLQTLGEEVLIPMPNLRYLRLHDNPWNCFCPLESLIHTLQVPTNRNLGKHARCAEPISLKNKKLKQVDPELLCKNSNSTNDSNVYIEKTNEPSEPGHFRGKPDAISICHTYFIPEVRMDCSNRGLTEVPSGISEDVVQLDLSHNSISHLKPRDFHGAKSLKILKLNNNNMEHIDTGSLFGLLHLHEMDLSHNNLTHVQYGVLEDLYFLSQLNLKANPWVCDYSIHYMAYWLRLHPGVRHSGLKCHSPSEYTGKRVEEYVHSYNRECTDRQHSRADPDQANPELWETLMEAQREVEEELEPSGLRAPQKYEIIRLS